MGGLRKATVIGQIELIVILLFLIMSASKISLSSLRFAVKCTSTEVDLQNIFFSVNHNRSRNLSSFLSLGANKRHLSNPFWVLTSQRVLTSSQPGVKLNFLRRDPETDKEKSFTNKYCL